VLQSSNPQLGLVGVAHCLSETPPMCIRLLVVSALIRLSGIKFVQIVKRSPRLGDSQYFFSEESHNLLDSLAREQRDEEMRARDISATADAL
jgi:hypothetical protein